MPALLCGFCIQNSDFWTRITSLYGSQTSPVVLFMQNSVICTRLTSLYGYQPASVVLCTQNSDFKTRRKSLYWSQTSSVVLSTYNSVLSTRTKSLYWFQPSSVVCPCKTATLGLELQVSVGPRTHLWCLHAKQLLLDQNNKSLWVPDITCRFVHVQHRASFRITSPYGSQPSSVAFACKTATLGPE